MVTMTAAACHGWSTPSKMYSAQKPKQRRDRTLDLIGAASEAHLRIDWGQTHERKDTLKQKRDGSSTYQHLNNEHMRLVALLENNNVSDDMNLLHKSRIDPIKKQSVGLSKGGTNTCIGAQQQKSQNYSTIQN